MWRTTTHPEPTEAAAVTIRVDSRDRDRDRYPSPSRFRVPLPRELEGVRSAELVRYIMPFTRGAITEDNRAFWVEVDWSRGGHQWTRYRIVLDVALDPSDRGLPLDMETKIFEAVEDDMAAAPLTHPSGVLEPFVKYDPSNWSFTLGFGEYSPEHPSYDPQAPSPRDARLNDPAPDSPTRYEYYAYVPVRLTFDDEKTAATYGFGFPDPNAGPGTPLPVVAVDGSAATAWDWRVRSSRPRDLEQADYVSLFVRELPGFRGTGRGTDGALALLYSQRASSLVFGEFLATREGSCARDYSLAPLRRVRELTIEVRDPSGVVYDTRGRDLVLEFAFTVARGEASEWYSGTQGSTSFGSE